MTDSTAPAASILIVDDEPAVHQLLGMALKSAGHDVEAADTIATTLERVAKRTFDVVMVDKNLPDGSGVDLIRELRKRAPTSWCLMMTAHPTAESARETLELGVYAYIEKPFDDVYDVLKRIDAMIDARRTHLGVLAAADKLRALTHRFVEKLELHVLIASADAKERDWLAAMFRRPSDRVRCAGSSEETTQALSQEVHQLLIIDTGLPGRPVADVLKEVRTKWPATLMVVVSNKPVSVSTKALMTLGLTCILERPLEESAFRAKVYPALRRLQGEIPPELVSAWRGK